MILVENAVDYIILHTNYLLTFTNTLGSIMVGVIQFIYNIGKNLLSHILDN